MKKRLWILYGTVFTVLVGLIFRIYTLSDQYLARAANEQSKVSVTIANTRGTFYDRNLQLLVNDRTEYRAGVTSSEKAIAALSKVLDKKAFFDMNEILKTGRPAVVTLEKLAAAEEGITLFQVPKRYNERVLAPHLIGYMNADQTEGLTGLEAAFDTLLSSYNGSASVSYTVDAKGNPLNGISPVISDTTAISKGGVQLTLDKQLQWEVEDIAAKYIKKGAVIVMRPQTGEILSMVSLPTFQPQAVADVLESSDAPLLNRALCRYNCGSVFKIVTAAAALEKGVSKDTVYNCEGKIQVGDTTFHCHNRLGHGLLTMTNAFAKSCNSYFIQLMNQNGGDALWRLAYRLEFNSKLTLCDGLSTEIGTLPDLQALQSPAVLANFSFGQGELTATPLHIAQLICTVVNDGKLVIPKIVKGYVDQEGNVNEISFSPAAGQQVFSGETASRLRDMMQAVVTEEGTGFSGKPLYGDAGAKTGTAETGWEKGAEEQYDVVHSWYAGFYPANQPEYVIVVLAENAENTGAKTATVFKKIADTLYQLKTAE
jgi:cell division protein FtsI/penicillin-binding protein 2